MAFTLLKGCGGQTAIGLNLSFVIRKKPGELGPITDVFSSVKTKPEITMPTLGGCCEALNEMTCEKPFGMLPSTQVLITYYFPSF